MKDSKAMTKYTEWLNANGILPEIKRELFGIISRPNEIEERFSSDLEFGTAGFRDVMGMGSSRINIYTIAGAAKGFAEYVKAKGGADRGIVISYDSRNNSRTFAEVTARIAAETGVKVMLSNALRPVPMLSYAIRYYGAYGGVMITASHNPPEYNGFKAYGPDGGQLSPDEAAEVKANIEKIENIFEDYASARTLERLMDLEKIRYVGSEIDYNYIRDIKRMSGVGHIDEETRSNLRIVYTPLNGTGNIPLRMLLAELGYDHVITVREQLEPDGNFPTMVAPNPEREDTFNLAKKYAESSIADVVIATDPDGDRLGVAIRDNYGNYKVLTGNQIGLMLMEYILSRKAAEGSLNENSYCAVSIVSSKLARSICARYGVRLYETPTGSKYIAELIKEKGEEDFVFAFEEGNGFIIGNLVRDKDAINAAAMIAGMAATSEKLGKTLYDQLTSIYTLYGHAAEKNVSITEEGLSGKEKIAACMDYYRSFGGKLGPDGSKLFYTPVKEFIDLKEENVLIYRLGDLDYIAIRPSGTEPKLKLYFGFYGEESKAESDLESISGLLESEVRKILG
jgi:phosphoglucomutase